MNRAEANEYCKNKLKDYVESITQHNTKGSREMYHCPIPGCNSGNGPHGTGAFQLKSSTKWCCYSCGKHGDIFDLIGYMENITDKLEQLKRACKMYNVEIDKFTQPTHNEKPQQKIEPGKKQEDLVNFFLLANKNIENTDYHRGLSLETLNRYKIGYIAEWRHPEVASYVPTSPRLIIPTSRHSYTARDTRPLEAIPEQSKGYTKQKVGSTHIFNDKALKTASKPIFIVEGEIDALSIIEVGGESIGLGTIAMIDTLLATIKGRTKSRQPLIIALDNDKAGKTASEKLANGLRELEVEYCLYNPCGQYKDANEALNADREAFTAAVGEVYKLDFKEFKKKIEREAYLKKNSAAAYIDDFINNIATSVNTPCISTGFKYLDEALDGGLYEGLYIVGAISSLGKTTLITQIGDQIAQAGHDVLIFSLEMARTELMAKSISRHTIQNVLSSGGNVSDAKTVRGITDGKRYFKNDTLNIKGYTQTELNLIDKSIMQYREYANNIIITEGLGNVGAEKVSEDVRKHVELTGKTPVVIIDYLQILAPFDARSTDKQNTDKAVLELKRISRDYKTPVIAISSFNRENYKTPVGMAAFKESGAIEYSSDVLFGLQLKGTGQEGFNVMEAKKKNPREIELVILKNRNGKAGEKVCFNFHALFNYFEEIAPKPDNPKEWEDMGEEDTEEWETATRATLIKDTTKVRSQRKK